MSDDVKKEVRSFIVENFLFGDAAYPLDDALSLVEGEIVDSTGILELVTFLEERFGIRLSDAEIVPDNLDSLDRIAAFVVSKRAAENPAAG